MPRKPLVMRFTILLILVFFNQFAIAQILNKSLVKQSDNYYWGEAVAENEKEASDAALADLTQHIAVTVSSSFQSDVTETNEAVKERVRSILKTYSAMTLRNVKTIRSYVGGKVDVFDYLERSEVSNFFKGRVNLIKSVYEKGKEFESDQQIGYALKWYYFAIVLMNSVPFQAVTYDSVNLKTEIPFRITNILNNTRFRLAEDTLIGPDERKLVVSVIAFNKPAKCLDFSFWDGTNQVNVHAIDGEGTFTLFGASTKFSKLDLQIKYSYYESRDEIKEVAELWNLVGRPSFDNTTRILLRPGTARRRSPTTGLSSPGIGSIDTVAGGGETKFRLTLHTVDSCAVLRRVAAQTLSLLDLIDSGNSSRIRKALSGDAFLAQRILALMKFNHISFLTQTVNAEVNRTYEGWELRKIRVHTYYPSLDEQSTEYLVLDFTKDGKLYNITFAIPGYFYKALRRQGMDEMDWSHRQVIIKFIEKYRTAFMTRDTAAIASMFSDRALIIVGRVLKESASNNDLYRFMKINDAQPTYQQIRLTKDEYLKRQKRVFRTQRDIYLSYSTLKIRRKNKQKDVYGISMRQHYVSTDYSDEGYLFLLVDFDEKYPQIYVRAWQPQEWNDSALIGLSNFNVNK